MSRQKKEVVEKLDEVETKEMASQSSEEVKATNPFTKKELAKEKLNKLIEEETKLVKGRFRNYEAPGGNLRVQIRKYPGIPPFDKVMVDNEMYEVPLYVARHLNGIDASAGGGTTKTNTCAWPTHNFQWDRNKPMPASREDDMGVPVPILGVSKWTRRFGFESTIFDPEG
jgi:gamma-glutamylcyclotransferase (GGCT)/AIG2-like uncharacterized protein YtfP